MKMEPRTVATAIMRNNGKWAVVKNPGRAKLSSARLRPLRALVAAIEKLASWEWASIILHVRRSKPIPHFPLAAG